jgi:hypothetical protein
MAGNSARFILDGGLNTIPPVSTALTGFGATASVGALSVAIGSPQPAFSNVVLLLDFEGSDGATSTTDESGTTPHTMAFGGNAQIDTAQKAVGNSSALFDGASDYIRTTASNADFDVGTGQFCIEYYVRFNTVTTDALIAGPLATQLGIPGWHTAKTSVGIQFRYFNGSAMVDYGPSFTPSTGVWYHIAFTRDASNNLRAFRDGVMVSKDTGVTTDFDGPARFNIGGDSENSRWWFDGWIDAIRLTKGEGVYVTDDSFTPPTSYPRS